MGCNFTEPRPASVGLGTSASGAVKRGPPLDKRPPGEPRPLVSRRFLAELVPTGNRAGGLAPPLRLGEPEAEQRQGARAKQG